MPAARLIAGLLDNMSESPPLGCKCAWHVAPDDHTELPTNRGDGWQCGSTTSF
jgi:hypothetical protein